SDSLDVLGQSRLAGSGLAWLGRYFINSVWFDGIAHERHPPPENKITKPTILRMDSHMAHRNLHPGNGDQERSHHQRHAGTVALPCNWCTITSYGQWMALCITTTVSKLLASVH